MTGHRDRTAGPRARRGPALTAVACGLLTAACAVSTAATASARDGAGSAGRGFSQRATAASRSPGPSTAAGVSGGPTAQPLAGKIVGIDPGHNGRNGTDPA